MPAKTQPHKKQTPQPEADMPAPVSLHDVEELLVWDAPSRVFRKRTKEYYINSGLIMLLVLAILFLFAQYGLMLVVLSLGFLVFALSITPPHTVRYRISTEGVSVDDHFYLWQELYDFFFKKHDGEEVLFIRTKAYVPGFLVLIPGPVPKEDLKQVLLPFLPYRERIKTTFTERAGDWMSTNFPLEKKKGPVEVGPTPHVVKK